ncbi:MAG: ATP-binding cassette domain-containing protein, partial [Candidatus Hydrogenedentes bacterium]|nr:ATP-binding cassette domain-containing protein [Candidatus Hydrogenedentota bacterium]
MSSNVLIEMQEATVSYNGIVALDHVSLQVSAGECIALIGANGAGKTTLLTVLNGFTPLTSGSVCVLGSTFQSIAAVRVRRRIGYVAQAQPVDPRMPVTLYESVMTGVYGRLGWRHKPASYDRAFVRDTLNSLHLLALADRPLGHLSGGELRRTMIARCLVQEPEL